MTTAVLPSTDCLLLTAGQVGELLGLSARAVWRLLASGALPRPVKLGRATRWRRREIEAWCERGCPSRDVWDGLVAEGGSGG